MAVRALHKQGFVATDCAWICESHMCVWLIAGWLDADNKVDGYIAFA
jgi:hypothetical protein